MNSYQKTFFNNRPGLPYYIVRRKPSGWLYNAKRCHKWTQTTHEYRKTNINPTDYWRNGTYSHSILQADINRVIELYQLRGTRDLNTPRALSDILQRHVIIQTNEKAKKLLHSRLRRTISYKRYYEKKRVEAMETGRLMEDILHRRRTTNGYV